METQTSRQTDRRATSSLTMTRMPRLSSGGWMAANRALRHSVGMATMTPPFRTRNAVPNTPVATPVSITQSLSTPCLKHMHLLGEHGADGAALSQHEVELADAQAHEVDAHNSARLQTGRPAASQRCVHMAGSAQC